MTLHPEAKWTRQDRNRKQRRSRKQQDHVWTAAIAAIGAGDAADWPQDDEQPKRWKKESGDE